MPSQVRGRITAGMVYALVLLATRTSNGDGGGHLYKWTEGGSSVDTVVGADVFFEIVDPPELGYTYRLRPAKDFGAPFNSSFLERRIALVPTEPATGCERPSNAEELEGRIALIERGDCSFFLKTLRAEEAGAKAVIISDYYPSSVEAARSAPMWVDYYYIAMNRDDSIPPSKSANIPAGFLLGKNGRMIRETLRRLDRPFALVNIPVNLTFASIDKIHQPPWLSW